MTGESRQPAPRREVVTGEPRRVRPLPRYRAQAEIEEQTALGDAYVRSLMRSQLRAGLSAFAVLALVSKHAAAGLRRAAGHDGGLGGARLRRLSAAHAARLVVRTASGAQRA